MASSTETGSAAPSAVALRYFDALGQHDLDAATACWTESGIDRFVGQQDVVGPAGVRRYFEELFAAFPDFAFEVVESTSATAIDRLGRARRPGAGRRGWPARARRGRGARLAAL